MTGWAQEREIARIIAATIAERSFVVYLAALALPDATLFHGADLAAILAAALRTLDDKLTVATVA